MRHRKKYLAAFLVLAAAYATVCFWPHSNPEAARALAAARELVQIDDRVELPPFELDKEPTEPEIEFQTVIVAINMTDATAGLFATPGGDRAKTMVATTKSVPDMIERLQATHTFNLQGMPKLTAFSGQTANATVGTTGVMMATAAVGGGPPIVVRADVGTKFSVTGQVTAQGAVAIEMDCELTRLGRMKKVPTPQGPIEVPEFHSLAAKVRIELKPGETVVIGGLAQKRPERVLTKLPGLGELPGIGSWFSFTRQRDIEEELIVLVTPRIISPDAAADQQRQVPRPPVVMAAPLPIERK